MKQTANRSLSILLALLMLFSAMTMAAAAGSLTLESATIGDTPLAEATTIRGNDEILLTFSGKVTDESILGFNIGKISVKDSSGNTVSSVTVSPSGNKKFIVSLGGLAKATYTLQIGKQFKDVDGNTLGQQVALTFTVNKGNGDGSGTGTGGGNSPLSFVSATADGKDLENAELAATGTITVTFDRGMTKYQTENFAQISILDKDGKKVDGVTFTDFTKDANDNSYTVLSYKDLAAGTYTLKLGKDLKANNDNTLGKAVNISFTVKAQAEPAPSQDTATFVARFISTIVTLINNVIDFFRALFK